MSVLLPEGEVVVAEALPALGILCFFVFCWGLLHGLDGFVRALFGTVNGAIGWIPYAGRVLERPVHKIEQKVSHVIGSAEQTIDAHVASSFHKLARIGVHLGREIEGQAKLLWGVVAALDAYLTFAHFRHLIRALLHPIRAEQHVQHALTRGLAHQFAHLRRMVVEGVFPRLRTAEHEVAHVIEWDIPHLRTRTKALEREYDHLNKWIRSRPWDVATKAFVGAVAIALALLGGSWIRCKNWRAIGKHVCSLPWKLIEALLGLGLAFAVVIDPRKTAEAAVAVEDAMESLIRQIAD